MSENLDMTADLPLETWICDRLAARSCMLATAESCSGGLIAHRITNVPGASAVFLGGVVAYSNPVKEALLGVESDVLREHGAVSEAVARQMAEGVKRRLGADYGVGVTGIAGPTGGTHEKPVGLVYIGATGPRGTVARRYVFSGTREEIKNQTAHEALVLLKEIME